MIEPGRCITRLWDGSQTTTRVALAPDKVSTPKDDWCLYRCSRNFYAVEHFGTWNATFDRIGFGAIASMSNRIESQRSGNVLERAITTHERKIMLYWAAVFFVIALIAGIFGFGGIAGGAASIAQILFVVFLVLFVLSLIFGRRGSVS